MPVLYTPAIAPLRSAVYVPNTTMMQPVVAPQPVLPVAPMEMMSTYPAYPTYSSYPNYPVYPNMATNAMAPIYESPPAIFAERQYPTYPSYSNSSTRVHNMVSAPATIVNRINNNVTPIINTPPPLPNNIVRNYHAKRTKVVRFPRSEVLKPALSAKIVPVSSSHDLGRRSLHVSVTAKGLGRR